MELREIVRRKLIDNIRKSGGGSALKFNEERLIDMVNNILDSMTDDEILEDILTIYQKLLFED